MKPRRFTSGETVALCTLVAALLFFIWVSRPGSGNRRSTATADSVYKAKADSIDMVVKRLQENGSGNSADSAADMRGRKKRKKKNAAPKERYGPRERNYLDEGLSADEAR